MRLGHVGWVVAPVPSYLSIYNIRILRNLDRVTWKLSISFVSTDGGVFSFALYAGIFSTAIVLGLNNIRRKRVKDRTNECGGKPSAGLKLNFLRIGFIFLGMNSPLISRISLRSYLLYLFLFLFHLHGSGNSSFFCVELGLRLYWGLANWGQAYFLRVCKFHHAFLHDGLRVNYLVLVRFCCIKCAAARMRFMNSTEITHILLVFGGVDSVVSFIVTPVVFFALVRHSNLQSPNRLQFSGVVSHVHG